MRFKIDNHRKVDSGAKIINNYQSTKKRRIPSKEEVLFDLKSHLLKLFAAFQLGCNGYFSSIADLSPNARRVRGYDASTLNAYIVNAIMKEFPDNWKFGKYIRFVLRLEKYNILVKKLNKKDMPTNYKSVNSKAIANQLELPLFGNEKEDTIDPILFFGFKKDKFGDIVEPKVVYIDGNVKWQITYDELLVKHNNNKESDDSTENSDNKIAG